eukprot:TRINITY_DN1321_c0_g1_i2.p2 TRINITY_DN1321_c0_g1~~TRINITY_DN1321_c0_g1_i2.p2  ORF type:complete len:216 (+),score=19.08 TRINITY_DN1321_c0_g1_i2:277-924(+)
MHTLPAQDLPQRAGHRRRQAGTGFQVHRSGHVHLAIPTDTRAHRGGKLRQGCGTGDCVGMVVPAAAHRRCMVERGTIVVAVVVVVDNVTVDDGGPMARGDWRLDRHLVMIVHMTMTVVVVMGVRCERVLAHGKVVGTVVDMTKRSLQCVATVVEKVTLTLVLPVELVVAVLCTTPFIEQSRVPHLLFHSYHTRRRRWRRGASDDNRLRLRKRSRG